MDAAVCSGADVVTVQAFETLAWLISPPVVGIVGGLLLLLVAWGVAVWVVEKNSRML